MKLEHVQEPLEKRVKQMERRLYYAGWSMINGMFGMIAGGMSGHIFYDYHEPRTFQGIVNPIDMGYIFGYLIPAVFTLFYGKRKERID